MLGEFHQQAKLDGKACHATYILSGFIEKALPTDDSMQLDDEFLMSSPPVPTQQSSTSAGSTMMIRTIILADEDDIHGTPLPDS